MTPRQSWLTNELWGLARDHLLRATGAVNAGRLTEARRCLETYTQRFEELALIYNGMFIAHRDGTGSVARVGEAVLPPSTVERLIERDPKTRLIARIVERSRPALGG
jgi:hypothetical protein